MKIRFSRTKKRSRIPANPFRNDVILGAFMRERVVKSVDMVAPISILLVFTNAFREALI